jgi:DNA-binding response OmpR family regulator
LGAQLGKVVFANQCPPYALERPHTVLAVDDDPGVRQVLRLGLEAEGYKVLEAENREQLFGLLNSRGCDLITLDLRLGQTDGLALAREIRAQLNVPIIMITGRDEPVDRVTGLEHGADDYITKPFHIREVVLRARTVLERYAAKPGIAPQAPGQKFRFDGFVLDTAAKELRAADGKPIELTETEYGLIEILVRNPSRVMSRDELWQLLRGRDWSPLDRTLDSHVARLRRKIESSNDEEPQLIKSVRGVGYVLAAAVRED